MPLATRHFTDFNSSPERYYQYNAVLTMNQNNRLERCEYGPAASLVHLSGFERQVAPKDGLRDLPGCSGPIFGRKRHTAGNRKQRESAAAAGIAYVVMPRRRTRQPGHTTPSSLNNSLRLIRRSFVSFQPMTSG